MDKISILKLVGAKIRAIRKSRGWTQEQLAEMIDTQHPYIGYVERGEQNVTLLTLEKIAHALKVEFGELFGYENFSEKNPKIMHIVEILSDKSDQDLEKAFLLLKLVFN
ncbi:MAG: helix-turn-helix transcriptional regulator [Paenibacillaceae bacterium]